MHKVAVRVLLFAKAREISGKKEAIVTVYSKISYCELFDFIVNYFSLEDLKSSLILAINEQYSDSNILLKLNDGDTIAVIPPLSGGTFREARSYLILRVVMECGLKARITQTLLVEGKGSRNNQNSK